MRNKINESFKNIMDLIKSNKGNNIANYEGSIYSDRSFG